ncbi:MAG: hypothetical protein FJ145_11145 [Deltaproteobacteria bacterium]|nr:hypothetical protein [Deltaproteobacteria bacterium]
MLHSAHCRACKVRVRELLAAIYGDCQVNRGFEWPSQPQGYAHTLIGAPLQQIADALGNLRGHRDYIKSPTMPPCDYFIADPGFILEFDESQHFSWPRLITLAQYPQDLQVGYSISRWQTLCRQIAAVDNTPLDRDERRAWYDTLRDLLPIIHGFRPTVRLYAGDFQWCALDPGNAADRATFAARCESRL